MSGFDLVPMDGKDPVHLPPGETVLGRGPLLDISDTRVSRNHGLLENLNGRLRIKPTHMNPCFIQSSLSDDPRPLEKGSWFWLHHGDLFSLLPGRFIYRVEAVGEDERTPRNSQNFEEDDGLPLPVETDVGHPPAVGQERRQTSPSSADPKEDEAGRHSYTDDDPTRLVGRVLSATVTSAPRRRILPAWMTTAGPKSLASHPKVQSTVKRSKQSADSSATQVTPIPTSLPGEAELSEEEEDRPRKKRRKSNHEEEEQKRETDVPPAEPTGEPQSEANRSEVSRDEDASSQTSEPEDKKRSERVRTPCPYGKDCYRKNPLHFQECSHPGDTDYQDQDQDQDQPECPYGTDCYRTNPLHRKQFKHTKKPARSTRPKHQNPDEDEDESGDEDSFINDDSEDVGEDSDYVPPDSEDSEQEDIQRLQKEASAFLKKRK
ncbi:aprataxin and PNK-like factor [Nematolebias whitei]|uniref:aprataxin and PNK-like factor n=1 Tax=Nematolebias whitei TaxID=451745 RepID=UPI0018993C87|nr:aprataxin and PNK-like factor [Nematolebias whitei]